ncbi:MAG: glycine/sarcosine/betaine reductase selenoprotein B family protein [Candidatus Binatia bacterium]
MSAPVDYIPRIRDNYARLGYTPYEWVRSEEPPPWTPLRKPLRECRLGLVASGGIYVAGQVAFHWKDDTSLRVVPSDVATTSLRATHFAYDLADARADPNVVFPIDTLRRLVCEGTIGELGPRAYTFMGGIYSTRRVREELAPALAARLAADRLDAVLLVPV